MFWRDIFEMNQVIILSIYGQVFFVLSLAIFLQSRRHSRLKLARDLRWLALFGILHAMHEWGMVFIPIQAEYLPDLAITILHMAQVLLLAASYAALLLFGLVLLDTPPPLPLKSAVIALIGGWFLLALFVHLADWESRSRAQLLTTTARYFLAFPGGLLAAFGLYRQSRLLPERDGRYGRVLRVAAWSLVAYAVVAGLIVAPAPFFPASLLNRNLFWHWLGIPIEVFRSAVGLVLAVSIVLALEMFEAEVEQLIERMEIEAVQAAERDRIGQEIHDGVMQGVYSVGLILDSMGKHLDTPLAGQRLTQAQQVLEQVILGLRRYMTSLRAKPPQGSLADELNALTAETRFRSLVNIRLDIDNAPTAEPTAITHIVELVQEALSNVVRHAGAGHVWVRLAPAGEQMELIIRDDGRGFPPDRQTPGYGLRAMGNHARLLGGQLAVESTPGKGTTVRVLWSQEGPSREGRQVDEREAANG